MHKKFDHASIEKKWQKRWTDEKLYEIDTRANHAEKEYVLVEWPYPSGNLHIGHWYAFAVPDAYVRARRMQGKHVLFPMGFDAFGLPAENAAIKRNLDPKEWTDANVAHMKGQLESMGNAFSWNATTSSTDPEYYKWTQWMFTKFFENDIAYRGTGIVNWCPGCNTVIANEQVLSDGTCERSGDVIEKREMPQWLLRITKYADRLIDDLDSLDWPHAIKESQRNWIGRSSGAEITFKLSSGDEVKVFTTRPDTLFGATYLVLAPEHTRIESLKEKIQNWNEVDAYRKAAAQKNEQDRLNATKEKTGVKLEGIVAINPASGAEIPVFIADYAIATYGTGALMAVPAHDLRDYSFASKFNIPIIKVIDRETDHPYYEGPGPLMNSSEFDGMDSEEAKEKIVEKVGGRMTKTYKLRDWSIGRQRYWGVPIPIVYDPEGMAHPVPLEHLPWTLPTDVDFKPTGVAPLAKSQELRDRTEQIFGKGWTPEVETMDTFVDSSWYFLRYIDNKNDNELSSLEIQRDWMPVDLYFGGAEHTTMHVLYSRFWQKALFDLGLASTEEPYTRRINRGLVLGPDGNKMSKSKGNVIDPDEQVARLGADTVKMYLAFMGPYGETTNYPWNMGGIAGIRRFLERVNGLKDHVAVEEPSEITALLHRTIDKMTRDIENFKFNTCISALMIFINEAEKQGLTEATYRTFLTLLAPFAPHLTDELWEALGETSSIHVAVWPVANPALLTAETVTIAVSIDGKVRATIAIPYGASEDVARTAALTEKGIAERLEGKTITRVVYVPNKILNVITSS